MTEQIINNDINNIANNNIANNNTSIVADNTLETIIYGNVNYIPEQIINKRASIVKRIREFELFIENTNEFDMKFVKKNIDDVYNTINKKIKMCSEGNNIYNLITNKYKLNYYTLQQFILKYNGIIYGIPMTHIINKSDTIMLETYSPCLRIRVSCNKNKNLKNEIMMLFKHFMTEHNYLSEDNITYTNKLLTSKIQFNIIDTDTVDSISQNYLTINMLYWNGNNIICPDEILLTKKITYININDFNVPNYVISTIISLGYKIYNVRNNTTNNLTSIITSEENNCSICMSSLNTQNTMITKCNHIFHKDCIFKSFETNSHCPNCRADLLCVSC